MNEERPKVQAFRVNVSKGDPIPVDAEELPSIITAIKKGMPCRVKQGVFNPSYYVSITEDRQRIDEIEHYNSTAEENNIRIRHYGGVQMAYKGLQPLKDIFEGIDLGSERIGMKIKPEMIMGQKFVGTDLPSPNFGDKSM